VLFFIKLVGLSEYTTLLLSLYFSCMLFSSKCCSVLNSTTFIISPKSNLWYASALPLSNFFLPLSCKYRLTTVPESICLFLIRPLLYTELIYNSSIIIIIIYIVILIFSFVLHTENHSAFVQYVNNCLQLPLCAAQ